MSLLSGIIEPKNAEDDIKKIYKDIEERFGFVPNSIKMNSLNPITMKITADLMEYFVSNSLLSDKFRLIANFLIAKKDKSEYCSSMIRNVLRKNLKMSENEIYMMIENPENAPLEEKESALLLFILKALTDSNSTTKKDIEKLNNLNIENEKIYDALNFATQMQKNHIMLNALKIEKD